MFLAEGVGSCTANELIYHRRKIHVLGPHILKTIIGCKQAISVSIRHVLAIALEQPTNLLSLLSSYRCMFPENENFYEI